MKRQVVLEDLRRDLLRFRAEEVAREAAGEGRPGDSVFVLAILHGWEREAPLGEKLGRTLAHLRETVEGGDGAWTWVQAVRRLVAVLERHGVGGSRPLESSPPLDWWEAAERAKALCERAGAPTGEGEPGGPVFLLASRELAVRRLASPSLSPGTRDLLLEEVAELDAKLAPHGLA